MSLRRSSQLLVAAAALVLSGCGAPAGFVLVSLAIDGAALVATGKTPGEHALSAIMKQDCAVRNLMANGDLCEDVTVTADVAVPATTPEAAWRRSAGGEVFDRKV